MNLHPLVVHFPIALWFIYCIILIIQLFWGRESQQLNTIKRFSLIIGTIGGYFSLSTGESAENLYDAVDIISAHESRAEITQTFFVVLTVLTLYSMQERTKGFEVDQKLRSLLATIFGRHIMAILGIIGIILMTIVGALGGAIARGTGHGDPISDRAVEMFVK